MIGQLPKTIEIDCKEYKIRTDYRIALTIFEAFEDSELSDQDKAKVMLNLLYEEIPINVEKAMAKAIWFLDGGQQYQSVTNNKKIMDWTQDQSMIFSAVNKVAGCETREKEYIHWWTFLGYFNEINEGLFTTVISIRQKKNKGKALEKYEEEFYKNNRELIEIKKKYTKKEQEEIDKLNSLFKNIID